MCLVCLHISLDSLTHYIFSQRMVEDFAVHLYCYLAVEVSYDTRDAKIQCSRHTEHSSPVVSVESDDFNSRTSFAQQYGTYMRLDIHFLYSLSSSKSWFPDQKDLYVCMV